MRFIDRQDAAKQLAEALIEYKGSDAVVYALPRGGVVLGCKIAKELSLPLDLVVSRKIGHPNNPEYAVCAVAEDGILLCDELEKSLLDPEWLAKAVEKETQEAVRRRKIYLGERKHISAKGKTAIIVDDGIATGLTIRAAIKSLRSEKPKELVVAVPVSPDESVEVLSKEADKVIVIEDAKDYLGAVGAYYDNFPQVTDEEVINILKEMPK